MIDPDGDGDFDVVMAAGTQLRWFKNDGQQNFSGVTIKTNSQPVFLSVDAADRNGDGDLELYTSYGVYEGLAAGESQLPRVAAPNAGSPGDDRIDGSDFLAWQRTLGQSMSPSFAPNDWDFSGSVDGGDLELWTQHYGQGFTPDSTWVFSPPVEPAAIPAGAAAVVADDQLALGPDVILSLNSATATPQRPAFAPPRRSAVVTAKHLVRDAALATSVAPLEASALNRTSTADHESSDERDNELSPALIDAAFIKQL